MEDLVITGAGAFGMEAQLVAGALKGPCAVGVRTF